MRDSGELVKAIKRIVKDTIENDKPSRVMYGKVFSINPLQVNVEQRMILDDNFLVVLDHLTKKKYPFTYRDHHRNGSGTLTYTDRTGEMEIDNSLKVNDKVILLRDQGGQKFVILDKVVSK